MVWCVCVCVVLSVWSLNLSFLCIHFKEDRKWKVFDGSELGFSQLFVRLRVIIR